MSDTPLNLDRATREQLRTEVARLNAELAKYNGKEPTVAEEIAYVSAENDRLEEIVSTATEHKFLIPGHGAGDLAYVLARRFGMTNHWGVIDETLGSHQFWAKRHGWYLTAGAPREAVFPWTEQEARRLARLLCGQPPLDGEALDTGYLAAQAERIAAVAESCLPAEDEAKVDAYLGRLSEAVAGLTADLTPDVVDGVLTQLKADAAVLKAKAAALGEVTA
jgi:hypothetical protein